ncbi:hypothetical protein PI124_g1692 [Phytophthora idaei]|nr:hypothetical protein PI126_g8469 [Phytophthora idaei]KAG3253719.1 hypothetical protein PI124_g1692 [Phytophthora idaei]
MGSACIAEDLIAVGSEESAVVLVCALVVSLWIRGRRRKAEASLEDTPASVRREHRRQPTRCRCLLGCI